MTPKMTIVDGRARRTGGWRAVLGRPLWVLSAGAGMGVVLGMTVWAGTALASGPGTATPSALQTQITALQRRMAQDEATINRLQSLLGGVTRSRDGSTLVITGNGAGTGSALKTVVFKGVNVQVVNGTGIETKLNGLGNLIIGYADNTGGGPRTGSHNLITGDNGAWTSYGGLLAGDFNQIKGPFDSIAGGRSSTASGFDATVAGGAGNLASGFAASANGGISNTVSGFYATASGGSSNRVPGEAASVSGGRGNLALGNSASVSGGLGNAARGNNDSILGGANVVIGTPIRCGFFPVSPATSHC
jgi:hypothetical protein